MIEQNIEESESDQIHLNFQKSDKQHRESNIDNWGAGIIFFEILFKLGGQETIQTDIKSDKKL